MSLSNQVSAWAPRVLSVLRIASALLFMQHGTMKLLDYPPSGQFADLELVSIVGLAGILELFGGALLLIGLFTRPVAFILSGMMAVAYFMAHAGQAFVPAQNGGEPAVLFSFIFLYLVFAGPGATAVDNLRAGGGARVATQRAG